MVTILPLRKYQRRRSLSHSLCYTQSLSCGRINIYSNSGSKRFKRVTSGTVRLWTTSRPSVSRSRVEWYCHFT